MKKTGPDPIPAEVAALCKKTKRRAEQRRRAKPDEICAEQIDNDGVKDYTDRQIRRICKTGIPNYDPWKGRGDCHFEVSKARTIINFIQRELTHVKGSLARLPFILERWQVAIVGNLIGWLKPDGTRRYNHCLVYVPRKNGKTTLAAAMVLWMLFADGEAGAEVYGAASEYKQACFVFQQARGMVIQNPFSFGDKLKIYNGGDKAIVYADTLSSYQVMSGDAGSKHGGNTHFAVIDELHCLPDCELVDTIDTSVAGRDNPMIMYLTTADYEREGSVCNKTHDYATKVLQGAVKDPHFLPVIYQATLKDDWTSPKVWRKANPNFGKSVRTEYLRAACTKAKESALDENKFKRLHLNIRTQQADRWLDLEKWDQAWGDVDSDLLKGELCFAGLDLASTKDLTALCVTFPRDVGYKSLWWFWAPHDTALIRARRDKAPYMDWAKVAGFTLTPGNETDYGLIRRDINIIYDTFGFQQLAVDRLFQGAQLSQDLKGDGIDVVTHGQGFYSMAAPTAEFERLINRQEYEHGGNPIMRWMVGHVAIEMDAAGNMKPSKKKSTEKIDGIVSAIMALGVSMLNKDQQYTWEPGRMDPTWDG